MDGYAECRDKLLNMLSKLQYTWDSHPGQVNIEKYCIELTGENTQPVYFTPYWAGPKAKELKKLEIGTMLL